MRGEYIVVGYPDFGRVMVNPLICDHCGRREPLEIETVGICAEGDEIDGCRLLALETINPDEWYRVNPRTAPWKNLDYCALPVCRAIAEEELKGPAVL